MIKEVIGNATLYCGDSNEILDIVDAVDSCVTDPPYGLSFMGKKWDYDVPTQELWEKVYQSIKQGGHLLSFFGSRTYHRGVIPIEDAGFDIRDQLMWLYGSGFPKSLNIGKGVDKRRGNNDTIRFWLKSLGSREELAKAAQVTPRQIDHFIGENTPCPQTLTYKRFILICDYFKNYPDWSDSMFPKTGKKVGEKQHSRSGGDDYAKIVGSKSNQKIEDINELATDKAKQWEGWGTALKPAHEPIVMARKPLSESSIVGNVLKHGTGGINIDECRVRTEDNLMGGAYSGGERKEGEWKEQSGFKNNNPNIEYEQPQGRFPANVMHDGSEVVLDIFPHTKSGKMKQHIEGGKYNVYGKMYPRDVETIGDEGSASRFFYCAKASKQDRDEGLDMIDEKPMAWGNQAKAELKRGNVDFKADGDSTKHNQVQMRKNSHPTVKPTELMRYLCRLVTPKGGVVLDPFMGSGSTGKGALLEDFKFIGIEMEREYFDIACARLEAVQNNVQVSLFNDG